MWSAASFSAIIEYILTIFHSCPDKWSLRTQILCLMVSSCWSCYVSHHLGVSCTAKRSCKLPNEAQNLSNIICGLGIIASIFSSIETQAQIITPSEQMPKIKTPAPVIHLSNNLDEKDELGYCIDTIGRGRSDRLHLHSCKPEGGDVQFTLDISTGL